MKRYISFLLVICIGVICMAGCKGKTESRVLFDKDKEYRILFIGNSFTDYNNLANDIFKPLCETAGYNVVVDTVTRGAYILELFANSADAKGALVDQHLQEHKYDVVILQEQSNRPISDYESFRRGVHGLAEKVKENGADLYLYETWGYKTGNQSLASFGGSTAEMARRLSNAYMKVAKEVDAKIIHAGIAMLDVYVNHKDDIELYQPDLYHPSYEGSTLVAYTMLCTIFGVDVRNVDYSSGSRMRDKIMKQAAYDAAIAQKYII